MALSERHLGPYKLEVHDLVSSMLRRFESLEFSSRQWLETWDRAEKEMREVERRATAGQDRDQRAFDEANRAQREAQGALFDDCEALLASWARLSLLFFPTISKKESEANREYKQARSEALRQAFGVPSESVLGDRDLRNSWMHLDERLDTAVKAENFGSRHVFVQAARADALKEGALLLFEVDTLVVHYKKQDGSSASAQLNQLRDAVRQLATR